MQIPFAPLRAILCLGIQFSKVVREKLVSPLRRECGANCNAQPGPKVFPTKVKTYPLFTLMALVALLPIPLFASAVPAKVVTDTGPGEWASPGDLCSAVYAYWAWRGATDPSACGTAAIVNGCPSWTELNVSRYVKGFMRNTTTGACSTSYWGYWQLWSAVCPANSSVYDHQGSCSCNSGYAYSGLEFCWPQAQFNPAKNASCSTAQNNSPWVFNPCNAATGAKSDTELILQASGAFPLTLSLRYLSRVVSVDTRTPRAGIFGTSWTSNIERRVKVYTTSSDSVPLNVGVLRPDATEWAYTRPASGTEYTKDADAIDRLIRLVDTNQNTTGWRFLVDADGSIEDYDVSGKLTLLTNRAGLTQTFVYSDSTTPTTIAPAVGLLIKVTDPAGRSMSLAYDSSSHVSQVTGPQGEIYGFSYDGPSGNGANNNLTALTYPDQKTKVFFYNESTYTSNTSLPNHLTGIQDENGARFATYNYASWGGVYSSEHANGVEKGTLYFNYLGPTDITDALGTKRTYQFTNILGVRKVASISQPAGSGSPISSTNFSYDANGNVASRTDFNGNKTTYIYDLTRNLETSRTEASGTALARTISTTWHPTYRLPTAITEPGRVTNYAYDATTGNLLTKSITDTATNATRTWTYTYTTTADGTLAALLKKIDGPRTDVSDITSYGYYPNGDLKTVTNALGHVTQITSYDPNGRPLTLLDPNNIPTTLHYTPRGWLDSRVVAGETTGYAYDGVGQLTRITFPDTSFVTYSYDNAHRLTDISDALGNHIHYTLDNIGNRIKEDTYNSSNVLVTTHSRVFDALNRLWKDIGAVNQTTLYTYDANGNLTGSTDPLGHTTVNSYDALNRLMSSTDALAGITRYGYDALDQLKSVADPRSLITNYAVNALGDQTRLSSPDTGITNKTYDASGNLLSSTDARGMVTTYTYDALNRVLTISYSSGHGVSFQYDAAPNAIGRVIKMLDAAGTSTWSYNAQGRVAGQSQVVNGVSLGLAYGYDSAGRVTSLTYPSGRVLSYAYDLQGRINSINIDGTPLLSNINYQAFGLAKSWTWGNGQTYARSFDQDGRVASYPLGVNLRALAFDAASRIAGLTDTAPAANQIFNYDNLDRLSSWIAPSTNQSYAYDANGNRSNLTIGATPYAYTVNSASNRLSSVAGPTAKTYSYDAAGHIIANGVRNYFYDGAGFMSASSPSTSTISDVVFGRNGLGQRVIKTAAGTSTLYRYDNNSHLIGEYTGSGGAIQETIYLGDQPIGVMQGTQRYYVFADHLNTPKVITNTSNTIVWRWDSDPFGTDSPNQNPSGLGTFNYNLRFPGQYADQETGLNYNYFRDYDPTTGRYVQSDPIGLDGGQSSTYAYVDGNPISKVDPQGLSPYGMPWVMPPNFNPYSQPSSQACSTPACKWVCKLKKSLTVPVPYFPALSVQAQISGQPGSTSTYVGIRGPGVAAQSNIECGFECGNTKGFTVKYSGAAGLGMGVSGSAQFNVGPQGVGGSATGGVASGNIQGFAPPSPGAGWTF